MIRKDSIDSSETYNFNVAMQEISARYDAENKLLGEIAKGNQKGALQAFDDFIRLLQLPSYQIPPRTDDTLRNLKNMLVILNSIFRKTVEQSQVHPIYIDRFSSRFAIKIEALTSLKEGEKLPFEMVKKYCYLVRNYSLATYSMLIRDTIVYTHMNLCSPLALKSLAKQMNVNASYLSSQFKKEVGGTVTDYIRTQRISMAVKLLNTTSLSVQEIACQVGIEDISYFSKQFKKQIGLSPIQYRKMLRESFSPSKELGEDQ